MKLKKYLAACDEASSLRSLEKIEAKDVFDAAKAGDAVGLKMVDQLGRYIGLAAANLAATTDPQKIIIGGGVSKAGDILIDTIVKHYQNYAFSASSPNRVRFSRVRKRRWNRWFSLFSKNSLMK